MSLIASCVHRNAPVRLVSTTDLHSWYGTSSSGTGEALLPALLNSRSTRPNVSLVLSNRALTDKGSPTSVRTTNARAPAASPSAAVVSRGSRRRPARTIAYPSRPSASAAALPIPDPAPVTTATLSGETIRHPPSGPGHREAVVAGRRRVPLGAQVGDLRGELLDPLAELLQSLGEVGHPVILHVGTSRRWGN